MRRPPPVIASPPSSGRACAGEKETGRRQAVIFGICAGEPSTVHEHLIQRFDIAHEYILDFAVRFFAAHFSAHHRHRPVAMMVTGTVLTMALLPTPSRPPFQPSFVAIRFPHYVFFFGGACMW